MRHFSYGLIIAGTLFTHESHAMNDLDLAPSQDLQDIFTECKLAKNAQAIPAILNKHIAKKQSLCTEIKHQGFFAAAEAAGVGTLKNRAMVTWCEGVVFERENTSGKQGQKKIEEKETGPLVKLKPVGERHIPTEPTKPIVAEHQKIVLRPVHIEKKEGQTMEDTQKQVNLAQQAILENIHIIEEKKDPIMMQKLEQLKESRKEAVRLEEAAKEAYDNLSAAVFGLREDIKEFINRPWAETQENKTPEEFVMNLEGEVTHSRIHLRSDKAAYAEMSDQETYHRLKELLAQANKNYNAALFELERINREMLELTQ